MRETLATRPAPAATGSHGWEQTRSHPYLAEGEVHVWRVDLASVEDGLGELLCPGEHERAERFLREQDRRLWIHAHGLLRVLLGRYLKRDPSSLRFIRGAHGKPKLLEDPAGGPGEAGRDASEPRRISFNLSHSQRLALLAFTASGEIGVDVEVPRCAIDVPRLAARAFPPAQAQRLTALDPAIREREFMRAWTRHEARLKCRGTGIGGASNDGSEPWISGLEVGAPAAGAIAVERPPRELRCWTWT
jgi:4'-phosphopantetheinyl transferase